METTIQAVLGTNQTKRHYRTTEERRRIVEATFVPGVSVAIVARTHGVNANQLFHWRKLYHAGLLGKTSARPAGESGVSRVRLLPVSVAAEVECDQPAAAISANTSGGGEPKAVVAPGSIELTVAKAQVRITGHVDAGALRVVLECLFG